METAAVVCSAGPVGRWLRAGGGGGGGLWDVLLPYGHQSVQTAGLVFQGDPSSPLARSPCFLHLQANLEVISGAWHTNKDTKDRAE